MNFLKQMYMIKLFLCLWVVSEVYCGSVTGKTLNDNAELIVTIKNGRIKGAMAAFPGGQSSYYSFKGIRYANVTKRFSAPEPLKNWSNVYDATKHGPLCPQLEITSSKFITGDENCLFLNVYTPNLKPAKALPVMVFIHGGSYMSGSGDSDTFGPEYLIQHDVVLVTINYRLEVLGFLSLDTPEVPGNAGMRDQVAALRWVQENIKEFGGDPKKVTLFGESAGASAVALHMQSPMSKGLFHRAIAQSGVSVNGWAISGNGKERALKIARHLGYNATQGEDSTEELLKFLRGVPAISLANLTLISMSEEEKKRGLAIHFAPVVETVGEDRFLDTHPLDTLKNGNLNGMPLMTGYNSAEAIIMLPDAMTKLNNTNGEPQYLISKEFVDSCPGGDKKWGRAVKRFYIGERNFTKEDAKPLSDMLSDIYFVYNAHRYVYYHAMSGPTYFYVFSVDTELNAVKIDSNYTNVKGAAHADDLFYLFYNGFNKEQYANNDKLRSVIDNVTKLWTDFAKYGNPTPEGSGVKWEPYTHSQRNYLNIGETFFPDRDAHHHRVLFWDRLYAAANLLNMGLDSNKYN